MFGKGCSDERTLRNWFVNYSSRGTNFENQPRGRVSTSMDDELYKKSVEENPHPNCRWKFSADCELW